jgi:hypothetical protein
VQDAQVGCKEISGFQDPSHPYYQLKAFQRDAAETKYAGAFPYRRA